MPKIYTSYFYKSGMVPNPISISSKSPDFFKGPEYKKLAPPYHLIRDYKNGLLDSDQYTKIFVKEVFGVLKQEDVIRELFEIYPGQEVVTILCYEKPGDFCHRHLVAEWLTGHGALILGEFH